jgi:hypothetical protein
MFKKLVFAVFLLSGLGRAAVSSVSLPLDWTGAAGISRANLNLNPIALRDAHNVVVDSLNPLLLAVSGYSTSLALASNQDLILKVDADANGTHRLVVTANNVDSLLRILEDGSAKFFGTLTVAGTSTFTGAATFAANPVMPFTANKIPFSHTDGSGTMTSSANLTYTSGTSTFATVNGTYSGTLGVTGALSMGSTTNSILGTSSDGADNQRLILNSGGATGSTTRGAFLAMNGNEFSSDVGDVILAAGNVSGGALQFATGAQVNRLTIDDAGAAQFSGTLGVTGLLTATGSVSVPDANGMITTISASNRGLIGRSGTVLNIGENGGWTGINYRAASGTHDFTVGGSSAFSVTSANVSIPGTATTTGKHTFTAAPRFSSANASEFLLTDGSKDLTSVGGTGSGSVVRATSPTLVTPVLGAATATSVAASGSVTALNFTSTGGEAFTYGDTSFTITVSTGMTTTPTGTAVGTRVGNVVTLFIPNISGTSNAAGFTLSGIPPAWTPATTQHVPYAGGTDNGTPQFTGIAYVLTNNTILLGTASGGSAGWTSSGTKATGFSTFGTTLTYILQ